MSNPIYKTVTDQIIAELEKGAAPWVKPWHADAASGGADHNIVSGAAYRGVNRLITGMASLAAGYTAPQWATYNQWQERGAQVLKGNKGTSICFYKPVAGTVDAATGELTNGYAVLKTFSVFNIEQTDAERPAPAAIPDAAAFDTSAACEATIASTGAIIRHGGDAAFYMPSQDAIQLPYKASFNSAATYYATAMHELTHWTGAKHRLARDHSGRFGNPAYAFEELVAEIGAAYLCADHGIAGELRHAGYIGHWLKACRDDETAIFKAAAMAQKAADFIKGAAAIVEAEAA
jgi:antirestriction protein ArdC